jgi:hypothetical protein
MACPSGSRFTGFFDAMSGGAMDLWNATFCTYAAPAGELTVGLLFYAAVSLAIFIRTGSPMIPFALVMLLGGTILAQMVGIVSTFAAILVLVSAPLIVAVFIFKVDRR